ncbi:hypothetical protein PVAP13_9NG044673 [Panicum virgatum]|uniref:Secreted protein n=1 Tax=Panicum virgatum TaxID=38727 RepID=A0A8T0ME81_PANVG|nr:hypothetical protein PVAP13_9NG044673 [Panicum virgatum]
MHHQTVRCLFLIFFLKRTRQVLQPIFLTKQGVQWDRILLSRLSQYCIRHLISIQKTVCVLKLSCCMHVKDLNWLLII